MKVSKSILLVSLLTITTGVFAEDFIFANGVTFVEHKCSWKYFKILAQLPVEIHVSVTEACKVSALGYSLKKFIIDR